MNTSPSNKSRISKGISAAGGSKKSKKVTIQMQAESGSDVEVEEPKQMKVLNVVEA